MRFLTRKICPVFCGEWEWFGLTLGLHASSVSGEHWTRSITICYVTVTELPTISCILTTILWRKFRIWQVDVHLFIHFNEISYQKVCVILRIENGIVFHLSHSFLLVLFWILLVCNSIKLITTKSCLYVDPRHTTCYVCIKSDYSRCVKSWIVTGSKRNMLTYTDWLLIAHDFWDLMLLWLVFWIFDYFGKRLLNRDRHFEQKVLS